MRVNLTKKEIINSVFMQIGFSKAQTSVFFVISGGSAIFFDFSNIDFPNSTLDLIIFSESSDEIAISLIAVILQ